MNVYDAIKERHCKRKFLPKAVDKAILEKVLLMSGNAASSKNSQPWGVSIVTGDAKDRLSEALVERAKKGDKGQLEYVDMPDPMPDVFKERARALGYELFALKGIERQDREARQEHWFENYRFFHAPVLMILHLQKDAGRGNFLDMGQFLQNIMLLLVEEGMGSCPQLSLSIYADTIKSMLEIGPDRIMVCGLSLGYVDESDSVNTFIPKRLPLSEYTQWIE